MKRHLLLLLAVGCHSLAAGTTLGDEADSNKKVATEIRRQIPAAAGLDDKVFLAVGADDAPTPTFKAFKSQPFTALVLAIRVPTDVTREQAAEFGIFGDRTPDISALVESLTKSKQHGYGTAIQPEFITKLTCKAAGDTAQGVVSFVVKSVPMHGNVHYVAKKKDGKWRIVEFSLPAWKVTTKLTKDGKWKLTRDELERIVGS